MIEFFKKYHKWLSIILSVFILLFAFSGIILNHRSFFSGVDISRNYLADEYQYNNWNNASIRGTVKISSDSILIYGNIGVWFTDSTFSKFHDFNNGFPEGIDNRKIIKVLKNWQGDIFAGTYFGLYQFDRKKNLWIELNLPIKGKRISDIIEKEDTLLVLSRSELLKTTDYKKFTIITLPKPENYDNKIGLFKTLWMIHSGEMFGIPGKLFVDFLGLIFIFLSLTGLIYFINPFIINKRIKKNKNLDKINNSSKWNIKWHNKIGWITVIFLIITTITGMFLRPPLLIPIANIKVSKIPFTHIDNANPWHDKLRRIIYDENDKRYIIATLDGIYSIDEKLTSELKRYKYQPPTSVMGVTVFEQKTDNTILVGSFEGLFMWNIKNGYIENYIERKTYIKPIKRGPPIGKHPISGYSKHYNNEEIYFDYGNGATTLNWNKRFIKMPLEIQEQPMSLWNLALEVHTARIYKSFIGIFYILIIPLLGLMILFILISGFILWYKWHR